jgi:aldehyde dehydrogenase (NAD+)
MLRADRFYIDGQWVEPSGSRSLAVIDPSTEEAVGEVRLGGAGDVERAVAAARRAFPAFSHTTRADRLDLLRKILAVYRTRQEEIAALLPREMGATTAVARAQAAGGAAHIERTIAALETFPFEEQKGSALVIREAIGVCGMISPWNNPVPQLITKAVPAMAAGCTTISKPSELAPFAASIVAEIMHEAGVPNGVFNLLHGDGATVGAGLAAHPDIDMIAFTGSLSAGIAVARAAAETVKRVHQELGGKSANIILEDADLERAVRGGVAGCFFLAGQTCGAPSRMLVPEHLLDAVIAIARDAAQRLKVGPPEVAGTEMGPLISEAQFLRVQRYIRSGIDEGAMLVAGGPGRPEALARGYYCRPTVFAHVTPDMTIAREEIFGPVLTILTYANEEDAIRMANDSDYGLVGYVQSADRERGLRVAREIRAGYVSVNYPPLNIDVPHGGYRRSGNGRQWAEYGIAEYLEYKALVG